jgi:hypothetical protein
VSRLHQSTGSISSSKGSGGSGQDMGGLAGGIGLDQDQGGHVGVIEAEFLAVAWGPVLFLMG